MPPSLRQQSLQIGQNGDQIGHALNIIDLFHLLEHAHDLDDIHCAVLKHSRSSFLVLPDHVIQDP